MSSGPRRSLRSANVSAPPSSETPVASTSAAADPEMTHQPASQGQAMMTDSQMSNQNMQAEDQDHNSSDNEEGDEYGDMHRLVLQGVMAAGYLDAKGVKKLFLESGKYLKCTIPAEIYPYIQKVIRGINEKIKIYDMMIRSATCEVTGEKYYVFLVTIEKPIMKFQTFFAKAELDLFQKIQDTILRKHNKFAISKAECVNLVDELESRAISKVAAEDFVDQMITMKYFQKIYKDNDTSKDEKDREYDVTLGFRTIREFEPILRDIYGDIFGNCGLCKMILLNGLQCPKCPVVIHKACLKKYVKNCKICVSCKGAWKNEASLPVRTRDGVVAAASQAASASQGSISQVAEVDRSQIQTPYAPGDDVDMPVLEPVISPPASANTRATPGSKRAGKAQPSSAKTMPARASKRFKTSVPSSESSDSE